MTKINENVQSTENANSANVKNEAIWASRIEFEIAERFHEEGMKIGYSVFNADFYYLNVKELKSLIIKKYENGGYIEEYCLEDLYISTDNEGRTIVAWTLKEIEED